MDSNPDLNIIEINKKIFGKTFGTIINLLLSIFIFSFVVITFWNLGDFVNSQYLNATPTYAITIAFLIPIIYILIKGFNTLARTSLILFYANILALILITVTLAPQIELNNFMPLIEKGIMPVLNGSYDYVAYNLLPLFLLTIIPKNLITKPEKLNKQVTIMYLLSTLALFIVMVLITGIFGINLARLFAYPEYHVLKRISLFNSIERLETMLSLTWLFSFYITLCLSIYYVCENIRTIINTENKKTNNIIIIITSLLALVLSEFVFKNHTQAASFLLRIYPHIMFIFLLGIPTTIFLKIKLTKKTSQ